MRNKIFPYLIFLIIVFISFILVKYTKIEVLDIFNTISLFTYFGVLIGFSITIYTFSLSMISDIKSNIQDLKQFSNEQKEELYSGLKEGFKQIKEDIWLIFVGIILVVTTGITRTFENSFSIILDDYHISNTIDLAMFLLSTIAMFDILKTMFNLSEINMEILPKNKS